MIIDAKTIIITIAIVGVAGYFGLQLIRSFALSIAQENHDANLATDMTIEAKRAKREREADAAAMAAFAKVEPLLPASVVSRGMALPQGQVVPTSKSKPPQAPISGGLQDSAGKDVEKEEGSLTGEVDVEAPVLQEADADTDEER
ncbi:hypothetical protein HJC23_001196 [Cyclotella cryptica]|uniref:Uncharacterized protein n=1 Tax=Cyclotella cryptica TaxID=29204 RepID=A0ABD3QNG3_9STRA|eukprot:CCRYP_003858-RA/>CCRYP_003858-RA protein AED:0.40 eAED:0.40 QI:0/-1/0/1/-1/1/1/0/144